ncbi:hypothetical protein C1N63_12960 [Pantoea ananatis]|nr:hypothetical protein C1N63_12960 [Pantoea ananatis]
MGRPAFHLLWTHKRSTLNVCYCVTVLLSFKSYSSVASLPLYFTFIILFPVKKTKKILTGMTHYMVRIQCKN